MPTISYQIEFTENDDNYDMTNMSCYDGQDGDGLCRYLV